MNIALRKGIVAFAICFALAMGMVFVNASSAQADDEVAALNVKVEETAKQYNEAKKKAAEIQKRIKENKAKLETLKVEIEKKRVESNEAVRSLYMYQRQAPTLINLVFSTDDVRTLFGTLDYLNRYENRNLEIINEQIELKKDLEEIGVQLDEDMKEAERVEKEAEQALKDAQAARQEAMERAAAEAALQLQRAEAVDAAGGSGQGGENSTFQGDAGAVAAGSINSGDVSWDSPKEDFVDTWTGRINNYLAGSPLSGYGKNFAEAAWDYGVDPRWSPAISCVESSKGAHCFRSHNAWGWGNSSWGSWEEAIDAHVAGLSRGYGFSLTLAAAKKYCPPFYQDWYNRCLSEMGKM